MKIPNKAIIRFEYNDEVKEYFFEMKELNDIIKEKQLIIDKAIKYIEQNCIDDEFYINLTRKEKEIIKLLDILRGNNE